MPAPPPLSEPAMVTAIAVMTPLPRELPLCGNPLSRRALRGDLDLLNADELQAALAPDHEQAGEADNEAADDDGRLRRLTEHEPADDEGPDHGRVFERRHQRGVAVTIALRQQDLADAAQDAHD